MIDSHCHLDLPAFENDWPDVLQRAKRAGVTRLLIPGTHLNHWHQAQRIASSSRHPFPIDIAIGLHPYFLPSNAHDITHALAQLESLLSSNDFTVVAVGEIGLDAHISVDMSLQKQAFDSQLQLAERYGYPVILHHRKSHHLIFESLKHTHFSGFGVIHGFSGSVDVAMAYIEKGFYIGVGGTITYERAIKTRNTVAYLLNHYPSRILLETDAPDMPMQGRQGQRNSPEFIGDVVNALCSLGHQSKADIVKQTTHNYYQLFDIKPVINDTGLG